MVTVIGVLLIIMGIFLVISVLMQSSKNHRVSGSIAGGAETFFGKQKGKTLDSLFNKLTTIVTIIFVILVLALCFILPTAEEAYIEQIVESMKAEGFNVTTDDLVLNEDGTYGYADYEAFVAKNADKFIAPETTDDTTEENAENNEVIVEGTEETTDNNVETSEVVEENNEVVSEETSEEVVEG